MLKFSAIMGIRWTIEPATNRYPMWTSKRKTKGKRDRSLKIRSNRRKAAK
jgi:hypothetical protein